MEISKKNLMIAAAVFTVFCIAVSAASGAFASVLTFRRLSAMTEPADNETAEVVYVTEAPVIVTEPATEKPTEPVITTEAETEAPSKTKSQIYYEAVNSVVGVTSRYDVTFRTLFGQSVTRQYVSTGSGFFVTDDGYLVTNYHVIESGTDITVSTYDEKEYPARVVGFDAANDIAVLKVEAQTMDVWLGDSSGMEVGDDIMVIGNALGSLSYTFTDGLISYTNRRIATDSSEDINMFQTNAAINSGNSGGPVYNMDGEVIGIASAKFASESIEGLCFFIPIDDVKDMIIGFIQNDG